ncbi:MAG: site-specific integrase [Nitrosopumilus sp.]|nr:site-specific integrase [Nitrosopumilus sp.]
MRNRNYLARGTKPYQYYYFHCIIPKDLRGILGKSVIRISLKNSDYCYSKIVSNSLYIIAQNIFEELRAGHMQDITLEDVKDILRQKVKQTIKHINLYQWKTNKWEPLELAKRIEQIDQKEKKILSRLQTDFIETNEIISKEIDKILIKKNLKPDKQNYEYAGLISRWTDLKVLRETWKRDLLNGERKTVNEYEQELEDKWKLDLFIEEKSESHQPSIIIEDSASEPKEPYIVTPSSPSPSPLFSEVTPKHLELMRRNKRRKETIGETEQTYEDVKELIGDKPIGEYTNLDGRNFRTAIISLPKNRKKMKQYRDFNLLQLLEMDVPEDDRLSVDTQTKLISRMTSLWNFLIDEYPEYVTQNVFKKKSVTVTSRKAKDKRESFTDEDIKTIFHHKNFLPAIFEGHRRQTIKYPYYFVPILAVMMGARLEEICQMRVTDIKKVNGIWVYRIREEGRYNEEETRVKNPYSERDIPLHPELIDTLRFVQYVNHIKKLGHERVFWELPKRGNVYHRNVGKFFNEKYLVKIGIKKRGKSFHSFRHSVETHLTNANVNGRYIDFLQGHSQKGVGGNVYMKGIRVDVLLKDCVEKIQWDVDWNKLKVKW